MVKRMLLIVRAVNISMVSALEEARMTTELTISRTLLFHITYPP